MKIEDIQQSLLTGGDSPHTLAEYKLILAGEYSRVAGQLETILARKPAIWNTMREEVKSDKACDRLYEATSDGIDEMVLKLQLKKIDKMSGAIGSLLRVAEGESRNQY